jgi:hypothetical protein
MSDESEDGAPGNQLAEVDAPLVPATRKLLRRKAAKGETRRRGCGVCRACLFAPHRQARGAQGCVRRRTH